MMLCCFIYQDIILAIRTAQKENTVFFLLCGNKIAHIKKEDEKSWLQTFFFLRQARFAKGLPSTTLSLITIFMDRHWNIPV